jgi:protein subunit release factor A
MEIKIYFCAVLYNEDSEIIQITDIKKQATEEGGTMDVVSKMQNSKTTLSALYKEGWRLVQAVPSHETNGYRLFLERA